MDSAKPEAAAARPVKALSNEITIGMSAPPIGITSSTPSSAARPRTIATAAVPALPVSTRIPSRKAAESTSALRIAWPAKPRRRPGQMPWSLANATAEPAKDTPPTSAEKRTANVNTNSRGPWVRSCTRWSSESATSAAAPPPTPLNAATICGIEVIATRSALT